MLNLSCFTGGIAATNGWLVQTEAGSFAVDAPEGFADWLAERGAKVDALLLTHQHFDHVLDAARIQREHGARVYAYAPFSRDLTLEFLMTMASGVTVNVGSFEVDEILEGRREIEVAGLRLALQHIPGHSTDSITFYSSDEGVDFAGDVLFAGSIGRCDFPGGSAELLIAGIFKKLFVLPDQTRVLSGHGPETTIGAERIDNPYLA